MARGQPTSLFVSSTCYDLAQLRVDIKDFATELGLEPILSEFDSFPVAPGKSTVDNCLGVLRDRADIFLLVVGGRYGSITEIDRSVTNLEFLEATNLGLPKYVFVKKEVLALLSFWKANPDANFSSVVDTPKLFEFITEIRDSGEVWVFPFEDANDIKRTMKKQLSFLMAECLEFRKHFHSNNLVGLGLSPKALEVAMHKPRGWEYLLLAQTLEDQLSARADARLDVELGISFGDPIPLESIDSIVEWVQSRMKWIGNTVKQMKTAIDEAFVPAVGAPGEPGDARRIAHLTERLGQGYEQLLNWKLACHRIVADDKYDTVIKLASELTLSSISDVEEFSRSVTSQVQEIISNEDKYKGSEINITLVMTFPNTDPLIKEIQRLRRKE